METQAIDAVDPVEEHAPLPAGPAEEAWAGPGPEQPPAPAAPPLDRPDGRGAETAAAGPRPAQAMRGELEEFLQRFPGVRGEDIPPAVWQAAAQGQNLSLAYSLHRNQDLERRLAALERQRDNRQRSTGPRARSAPAAVGDLIAQWWNEAET